MPLQARINILSIKPCLCGRRDEHSAERKAWALLARAPCLGVRSIVGLLLLLVLCHMPPYEKRPPNGHRPAVAGLLRSNVRIKNVNASITIDGEDVAVYLHVVGDGLIVDVVTDEVRQL